MISESNQPEVATKEIMKMLKQDDCKYDKLVLTGFFLAKNKLRALS